ncbi:MAG: helix-turn-helix domain-containing protein [Chitinivibrionales bacterium]|nr:helix-turn-helix domain-containing protein [Chitinivibrionales bacterium]
METKQQLAPLRRGIGILRAVAQHDDWSTFTGLQEALEGLPAPTLSRLLKVLVDERLVEKDSVHGRYRRGPALLELAHLVLGSLPKARLLQPVLDSLADQTGQSAALFAFDSDAIVMVAKAERPNSCHFIDVGSRNVDLARHGFARVILAHMNRDEAVRIASQAPYPPDGGMARLRRELAQIRERGVCVEHSESKPNWMRVTAPVLGARADEIPDAIGITVVDMPEDSEADRFVAAVSTAAQRASDQLRTYYAAKSKGA